MGGDPHFFRRLYDLDANHTAEFCNLRSVVAKGDDIVLSHNVLCESLGVLEKHLKTGKLRRRLIPSALLPGFGSLAVSKHHM